MLLHVKREVRILVYDRIDYHVKDSYRLNRIENNCLLLRRVLLIHARKRKMNEKFCLSAGLTCFS